MTNPYCSVLGIDVPELTAIEGHAKASTWTRFLVAIADPTHEEHEEYVRWAGSAYDPAAFDAGAVRFDEPGRRWVYAFGG